VKRSIYLKLAAAAFFWGSAAVAGKVVLEEMAAAVVTVLRFGIATTVLWALARRRDDAKPPAREHAGLAVLGLVGVSLCYYFYFLGLEASTAFNAGLIEATIPLTTLVIAALTGGEQPPRQRIAGFTLAYVGIVVVVIDGDFGRLLNMDLNHGDLLLLASTVCFGAYNVLVRSIPSSQPDLTRTYYIFLYGTLGLTPWLAWEVYGQREAGPPHIDVSPRAVFSLLLLSLGASVLAYVYFNEGIRRLGASRASSFINLVPLITVGLSIVLLRERPSAGEVVGAGVVFAGVLLSQRSERTEAGDR